MPMNIDLHVHTSDRSPCAHDSEEVQIQAAIEAGLHALFITDHWKLVPMGRLAALNSCYAPFNVFGGIEISIDGEDLLVLGIQDPSLEQREFTYPALHAFVRAHSGFMVLAHPFRYHPAINLPIEQYPPDAIELYSQNTPRAYESEIRMIARQYGLALLSNSDAHTNKHLGGHYNILQDDAQNEAAIFSQLRSGSYHLYS
jgi:hypothetical protein